MGRVGNDPVIRGNDLERVRNEWERSGEERARNCGEEWGRGRRVEKSGNELEQTGRNE